MGGFFCLRIRIVYGAHRLGQCLLLDNCCRGPAEFDTGLAWTVMGVGEKGVGGIARLLQHG